jgi:hypothetical protein
LLRSKGEVLLMHDYRLTGGNRTSFTLRLSSLARRNADGGAAHLARLLRDTGRREDARLMLGEIYSWFTEGFDTGDLKEAKALLEQMSR